MNCRKALELMAELDDRRLGTMDCWRLRVHLVLCHLCRTYLASYRTTVRLARTLGRKENPSAPDMPEPLVSSILESLHRQ